VFTSLDGDGQVTLTLRYAVRARQARVSEDRVVRALLERFGPHVLCRKPEKAPAPPSEAPGPSPSPITAASAAAPPAVAPAQAEAPSAPRAAPSA
jgi:hypothetical protein